MRLAIILAFLLFSISAKEACAQDINALEAQLGELTQTVKELQATVIAQQQEIAALQKLNGIKGQARVPQPVSQPISQAFPQPAPVSGKLIPEIGVVADIAAQFDTNNIDKEHGNRLNVREVELVLGSNVDPYSRLDATLAFTEDETIDIEEAYLTRFGLPFDTTARVGRFLPKIGKALPVHRDSLDTVDEPFVIQRYFGDEGLHKTGVDLTTILDIPLPSVHQITIGVLEGGSGEGGTAFGDARWRPTLYGHLKNYADINDSTNFELGISDAIGCNNNYENFCVNILGLDGTLRHTISASRDIKLQGETFYAHRKDSPTGIIDDTTGELDVTANPDGDFWGGYGLFDMRISQIWGTGFRFDYVQPIDRLLSDPDKYETGYTGYITFYQSEFARWRVQFSHIALTTGESDNRTFIQGAFAIGEHKHKLQ